MPPQTMVAASREQVMQVINFNSQPAMSTGVAAADNLRLKLDRNGLKKDALQCVP